MHRPLYTLSIPDIMKEALKKRGFTYYEELLNDDGKDFKTSVTSILHRHHFDADELKKAVAPASIDSISQLLELEASVNHIPTFCQSLDRILGGGVASGTLLHVYGGPGSGKTQLSLQLCVNVQLPESFGGLEGASVFIDTDSGFSPSRLREIAVGAVSHCRSVAANHGMVKEVEHFTVESILNNVHYLSVSSHVELLAAVELMFPMIANNSKVKLVVVDSLIFPYLTLRNSLEKTRLLYLAVNKLVSLADNFNIAVVFTNHLTTKFHATGRELSPAMGDGLGHRVPQSLLLADNSSVVPDTFSAVLSNSCRASEEVVQFSITGSGIRDCNS